MSAGNRRARYLARHKARITRLTWVWAGLSLLVPFMPDIVAAGYAAAGVALIAAWLGSRHGNTKATAEARS